MTLSFFPNIPAANNDPADDQPLMLINNGSINAWVSVDHIGFNVTNGGFHNIIHQVIQTVDPAPIVNINQIYSKLYIPNTSAATVDTQLFNMTGLGGISQLTGNNAIQDGYVWAGGLLFQWGIVSMSFPSGSTTGTVTFKDRVAGSIPFVNNCFIVLTTPLVTFLRLPTHDATVSVRQSSVNNLSFDWQFFTNSNQYIGFFWFAVGN
jgi:hypothetical protein